MKKTGRTFATMKYEVESVILIRRVTFFHSFTAQAFILKLFLLYQAVDLYCIQNDKNQNRYNARCFSKLNRIALITGVIF